MDSNGGESVWRFLLNLALQEQHLCTREKDALLIVPVAEPPDRSLDARESQHVESKCWVSFAGADCRGMQPTR